MKKDDSSLSKSHATHGRKVHPNSGTTADLNAILRDAYRRHTRGRIARAAMAACLGR